MSPVTVTDGHLHIRIDALLTWRDALAFAADVVSAAIGTALAAGEPMTGPFSVDAVWTREILRQPYRIEGPQ